jgi:hypothetical protein
LEAEESSVLEIINNTNQELQWLLTAEIFKPCKLTILRQLIQANEQLESRLAWDKKTSLNESKKTLNLISKESKI